MNSMKLFKENIENLRPITNLENYKSMPDDLKDFYITLNCQYRALFIDYCLRNFDLKKYDDQICNSKFEFKRIQDKEMDIYQALSCEKLSYFYIRNNFYIERLTEDEKRFLYDCFNKNFDIPDIVKDDFIKKTYQKVIFEDVMNNGKVCSTNYGPPSYDYYYPNNSIIIGIRHDYFNEKELSTMEEYNEKEKFIVQVCRDFVNVNSNKVDVPLNVANFDGFSVKPLIEPQLFTTTK